MIDRISGFANVKIAHFRAQIGNDEKAIKTIQTGVASGSVSTTDKLLFQPQLRNFQEDDIAAQQLLLQAEQVEAPKILTAAVAEQATARSRRNSMVVAALIGLVLGVLAALFWDRIATRLPAPGEE